MRLLSNLRDMSLTLIQHLVSMRSTFKNGELAKNGETIR